MTDETHEKFMREALAEGRKALPDCRPNPPVGCVLVRDDQVVARGFAQVSGDLSDIVAYVTLEPCSFHNRTPSCSRTLIEAGIRTVVVGMPDPHPRNRGAGVRMMREAGVTVIEGVLEDEARRDMGPYVWQPGESTDSKVGD